MSSNIVFVAVARAMDRVVMATYVADATATADSKAKHLASVKQVLSAPDFVAKASPGKRFRLTSANTVFNFVADDQHRVYFVITAKSYQERLTFALIEEIRTKMDTQFADTIATASVDSLSKSAQRALRELCTK
jgi:hypothetical protein